MALKIQGIRMPPGASETNLRRETARLLHRREEELYSFRILRRSLDARETPVFLYTVSVEIPDEAAVLRRHNRHVSRMDPPPPDPFLSGTFPPAAVYPRPVVVGAGPAGLFAALGLARAGMPPVLLERGKPVEQRRDDVERFRESGMLDPESNIQFGEGGAGTFSDGKLNTGTRNPRHQWILQQLVHCGAPPDILYDARPHAGTDVLFTVLQNFRAQLLDMGTDIRFRHTLTDLHLRGGILEAVSVQTPDGKIRLPCNTLILAPGHSARDTFSCLYRAGVPMEPKPFAVGVRIEHLQSDINAAQYRHSAGNPTVNRHSAGNPVLPAASYQLSCHLPNGRGVFSFCVCPGGEVMAAASESGGLATNGMSTRARNGVNINGGLLVGITPEDFQRMNVTDSGGIINPLSGVVNGILHPLSGIAFQRRLESAAFALGNPNHNTPYFAPVQRVEDFLNGIPSTGPGRIAPTYRPGVTWTDLRLCLPEFVTDALVQALPLLGRKLSGFDCPDAVLTAVESRSSSPVRILRNADGQSDIHGLFPCGEGAGYAGGILSAAADGIRAAQAVFQTLSAP